MPDLIGIVWMLIVADNRSHVNTLRPRQNGHLFPDDFFSKAFSWMKIYEFQLKFHWSLFVTICQHWFRWWLGANQATSHYLNQWWLDHWHIYASLGLNKLNDDITSTVEKYPKHSKSFKSELGISISHVIHSCCIFVHRTVLCHENYNRRPRRHFDMFVRRVNKICHIFCFFSYALINLVNWR